jgi:hypothetical protein
MTPTNKLRFVKRTISIPHEGSINIRELREVEILQQWWQSSSMGTFNLGWTGDIPIGEIKGEWLDVPVEIVNE